MQLKNEFTVAAGIDETWKLLTDLERIMPCMPGASLEGREGEDYLGNVKIKVGPIAAHFRGAARLRRHRAGHHRPHGAVRPRRDCRCQQSADRAVHRQSASRDKHGADGSCSFGCAPGCRAEQSPYGTRDSRVERPQRPCADRTDRRESRRRPAARFADRLPHRSADANGRQVSERLRRLVETELNEEQLTVYRSITSGPRAAGQQHFPLTDEKGSLNGPFGVMLHAPGLGIALQEVGAAIRYRTRMSDRAREIAILQVSVATASEFEWYAHERVGRAAGLTTGELADIKAGGFISDDVKEQAISTLSLLLLKSDDLGDEDFAEASAVLNSEEILEVVVLVGYYRTLAQMMNVFAIGVPTSGI